MKKYLPILLAVLLVACSKEELVHEERFNVAVDGAYLPVHLKGNLSSGKFIIHVSGGPALSGIFEGLHFKGYTFLEEEFAMVYYDQRFAGNAIGGKREELTKAQFAKDLDAIVRVIKQRYHHPSIYLVAHSWGGAVAVKYMLNQDFAKNISGLVLINTAHNWPKAYTYSRAYMMKYAEEQVAKGLETDYWQEALEWYHENPVHDRYIPNFKHRLYAEKIHGSWFDPANEPRPSIPSFFFSPVDPLLFVGGMGKTLHLMQDELISTEYSSLMHTITTPSLILWGRHDIKLPYQMAEDAYQALGTDPAQKVIIYYEKSGHAPMYEEKEKLNNDIAEFINGLD